ncbi:MAG: DUF3152 domain-containing protein [Patescibacteria group bacterium]|nr:DUF3152 domain-containing protein [Patescibacteria group bacterium]
MIIRLKRFIKHKWYLLLPLIILTIYFSFAIWSFIKTGDNFQQNTTYSIPNISTTNQTQVSRQVADYLDQYKISLVDNDTKIDTTASELGVTTDDQLLKKLQETQKIKSALMLFISKKTINIPLKLNETIYYINAEKFPIDRSPKSATFYVKNSKIAISKESSGNGFVVESFKNNLLDQIPYSNSQIINASLGDIRPGYSSSDILPLLARAENIYKQKYQLVDGDKVIKEINPDLIITSIRPTKDTLSLADNSAKDIINKEVLAVKQEPLVKVTTIYKSGKPSAVTQDGKVGKQVINIDDLASSLVESVNLGASYSGNVVWEDIPPTEQTITIDDTKPTAVFKYKITTDGNVKSDLDEFRAKVSETLNDPRGWLQAGASFVEVNSGEQFEIQLIEPSLLPVKYPGICDSYYSCRVGRYVMINDDRWQNATNVWTGTLRDYRHMVVNHEVGHRLGLGHYNCPGAGQLAPLMQQQSINLQGCLFNPWPLAFEIAIVSRSF